MIPALIGIKKGQTQMFDKDGVRHPITIVEAGPCPVVQIKTSETDGYRAVQLGFGSKHEKNINKPQKGHFIKAGLTKKQPRFLREIRLAQGDEIDESLKKGSVIRATDVFYPGDEVMVTGRSKGKGFAGGVKRWGFSGGPATHGQSDRHRAPGSIGAGSTPGRVLKGKKMAGRMGGETVTVKGLTILEVNESAHELKVSGLIPGAVGSLVTITLVTPADRSDPADEGVPKEEEANQEKKEVQDKAEQAEESKDDAKSANEQDPGKEEKEEQKK